jgi:thiamine biosynthesis lipoprotein
VIDWKEPVLTIIKPTMLDFGACGKGYLVDIVSRIIENEGIGSYVVDAGGDMRHKGGDYLKVGLEDPNDFEKVVGVVNIKNQSLCGSAGNRRRWADLTHIINPSTLKSPTNILSVWVVSNKTIVSDILTTCLFFVPAQDLLNQFDFEYLILNEDYSIEKSEKFNADMFS